MPDNSRVSRLTEAEVDSLDGANIEGPRPDVDYTLPPQDASAEEAVLGSVLKNPRSLSRVVTELTADDFHDPRYRLIYAAMVSLFKRDVPIDYHMLSDELQRQGTLERAGGMVKISEVNLSTPSAAHIEHYGKIVRDHAIRRAGITAAQKIAEIFYRRSMDVEEEMRRATAHLYGVTGREAGRKLIYPEDWVARYHDRLSGIDEDGSLGISTGWLDVDRYTLGLVRGTLWLIAARPGMGKSEFAEQMALSVASGHVAVNSGCHAGKGWSLFVSIEMTEEELAERAASQVSGVNKERLLRGRLGESDPDRIVKALNELVECRLALAIESGITTQDVRAMALQLEADRGPLDLIVVDYVQLLKDKVNKDSTRNDDLGHAVNELKRLSKELNCTVVAPAQLSRVTEGRKPPIPLLADLRDCLTADAMLQDALTGAQVSIRDVKPAQHIMALGGDGLMRAYPVTAAWQAGEKPVFRVRTRSGRELVASETHPFMTDNGFVPLRDLRPGSTVALAGWGPPALLDKPERLDRSRLLGYLIGDGSYIEHRAVSFTSADEETLCDVMGIMEREFPGVRVVRKPPRRGATNLDFVQTHANGYGRPHGNDLREWLRAIGCSGQYGYEKRVPPYVFESGQEGARQFMAGYLASDGCVTRRLSGKTTGRWSIRFDTTSPGLAQDVLALLHRMNIVAAACKPAGGTARHYPIQRVELASAAANLRQFAASVPAVGDRAMRLRRLLADDLPEQYESALLGLPRSVSAAVAQAAGSTAAWRDQKRRMRRGTALRLADELQLDWLRRAAQSDVLWDEVASVTPAGIQPTYDIEVPGARNFAANGLIVHNSGELEQAADVVLMMYRDEMYFPDTEKRGITDVIVRKHRRYGKLTGAQAQLLYVNKFLDLEVYRV